MSLWTAKEAASATGGKISGEWQAESVAIDTRALKPGALFAALKGERADGHCFVAEALEKGAAAAVVSEETGVPAEKLLRVADTQKALEDLGRFARIRAQAKIAAVTGSVGKTSAKEMLKLALVAHGETFAGHGNFNNHIGTPLNLANLPPEARFAVFELGMNHAGEISALTRQVRPHAALVTNVESVHLEFFASEEKIADAKAEIFEGAEPDGTAILNADNAHFARLSEAARKRKLKIISFGMKEEADCRVLSWRATVEGSEVKARIHGREYAYELGALGAQWALLSAGILGTASALGCDAEKTAAALYAFRELPGRGRVMRIGEITLVDDSYNASPAAMRAALAKLALLPVEGRRIAALGDMRELGEAAPALHAALAGPLQEAGVDFVFTAGPLMRHLFDALPPELRGAHAESAEALIPLLREALKPGDCVLIKGSHGSHMYEVAASLAAGR